MYRIKLVNMPFGALRLPSIALTQLKSVLATRFGDAVAVDVCYLNHDVGRYLGTDTYAFIANSTEANTSGLGDWFFREAAYPSQPDNAGEYFRRYFPQRSGLGRRVREEVLNKRPGLDDLLQQLTEKYRLYDADLVGFTSMFAQNMASFALARKLKELVPEVITAMGGANCEPPMGQQIADHVPQIDFVFAGPALKSFPRFVEACLSYDLEQSARIPGVLKARSGLPLLEDNSRIGEELDINEPVPLDYGPFLHSFRESFPGGEVEPSLLFETSRGCWWGEKAHCTFCGLNGLTMAYRGLEPESAIALFSDLFRHSSDVWLYESVDNIMPRAYPKQVFSRLSAPDNAMIFYEVKSDLSEDDIRLMAQAHVKLIQPGIESLATATLKLMRKGSTAFQNLTLLKHCVVYDVSPVWNLLVGFPGEGEDVYRKYLADIPLMCHLPPPSGVFPVRFDRFSPYFNRAEEYGLDLHPLDFYDLVYPLPKRAIRHLAYYFADRHLAAPYFVAVALWIGKLRDAVDAWKQRWSQADEASFPQLCLADDPESSMVYDFRSTTPQWHDVGPAGRQVLTTLGSGLSAAALARALPGFADGLLSDTVKELGDLGLLFGEDGRLMALAHPKAARTPRTLLKMMRPSEWAGWLAAETAT